MLSSLLRLRSVLERIVRILRKIVCDTTSKRELLLLLNILQLLLLVMLLLLLLKMLLLLPRVLKRFELRMKRDRFVASTATASDARRTHPKTGSRITAGGSNVLRARCGSKSTSANPKRVIRMHAVLSRMVVRSARVARQESSVRQDWRRTVHDPGAGRAQSAALMRRRVAHATMLCISAGGSGGRDRLVVRQRNGRRSARRGSGKLTLLLRLWTLR